MATEDDAVREAATSLSKSRAPADECKLLEALGARMTRDASSFDPAHRHARVVGATDECGEVRVTTDGAWKLGTPEQDLLAVWGKGAHPTLARVLDGVQESFSSAKVSALVGEIKELLAG